MKNSPRLATWVFRVCSVLGSLLLTHPLTAASADSYLDFTYASNGTAVEIGKYTGTNASVTIPTEIEGLPVVSIGGLAFAGRKGLTNVVFPEHLNNIAVFAFSGCSGLTELRLPNEVTTIAAFAFDHCAGLTQVGLPDGLVTIGDQAFAACTNLATLTLPPSVTGLGDQVFARCTRLTHMTIPHGVIRIGVSAFSGCDHLLEVRISDSVAQLGEWAFSGCARLTAIEVDTANAVLSSREGVLFTRDQDAIVAYPAGRVGAYRVPVGVTRVLDSAFADCASLTSITLPRGVTHLGPSAFSGCRSLSGVYCEGDAPQVEGTTLFLGADHATVYYRAGTAGWGPTFAGRPTQVWTPIPAFSDWVQATRLADRYPDACGEADDPDRDGAGNLAEMYAGTDPTDANSVLRFDASPRPQDLAEEDRTALAQDALALHFQSVAGKTYTLQSAEVLIGGTWRDESTVGATTAQKRVVLPKPASPRFYRLKVRL